MKPTLLVLAAGMGSRYGGLKQLDGLGPNGETIMDYSIFDAIRGGFGKVVFVIREEFEDDFREKILSKYENHIPVEVVFQSVHNLPKGYTAPIGRVKPWGTNHALLMGKDVINEPFAVINADDFYGRDSFAVLGRELAGMNGKIAEYCMVGYRIGNTLSESGPVARGVCEMDEEGNLVSVEEYTSIERVNGKVSLFDGGVFVDDHTPVSMNMWGFTPDFFLLAGDVFEDFLRENREDLSQCECYIPFAVNILLQLGRVNVKVLNTASNWFGVTYAEDRQGVVDKIQALIDAGEYPAKLF